MHDDTNEFRPAVPALRFPTPRTRKIVSARYHSVTPKFMQPSWRHMHASARQGSARPSKGSARSGAISPGGSLSSNRHGASSLGMGIGGAGSSVAANVAAGRNSKMKHRYQPTVEEVAKALDERPYLVAQVVALRDDPTIDRAQRMAEIGKIVRECEAPVANELERLQANFVASAERKAGRRAAMRAFTAYHKEHVEPVARQKGAALPDVAEHSGWAEHGGAELAEMASYVDLIDARYLLMLHEHGGCLPCWGAIPETVRINSSNLWRLYGWEARGCLGVLVLSHAWLDKAHPDANGETLARLAPVLQCMLSLCGGGGFTVGVMIDYSSIPQPTRTHAELSRFKLALRALAMWYAHPFVPVLFADGPLPTGAAYDNNTRSFEERGWCEYELRLGQLCKSRTCLWSLAALVPSKLAEVDDARRRFDLMRSQMLASAAPPLAPSSFTMMMRRKVKDGRLSFSAKEDLAVVLDGYHSGFVRIFEAYSKCDPSAMHNAFAGHGWDEEGARSVAAALEYAGQKCKLHPALRPIRLNLEGNHFGEKGQRLIIQATKFAKVFGGGLRF